MGKSSYSLLLSLEAAQELDFREQNFGRNNAEGIPTQATTMFSGGLSEQVAGNNMETEEEVFEQINRAHRLPYVITNPPKDLELFETDLVFVLGQADLWEERERNRSADFSDFDVAQCDTPCAGHGA